MAKSAKKMVLKTEVTTPSEAPSTNVAGIGFKKTFTADEWREIRTKRREMHKRLFAVG